MAPRSRPEGSCQRMSRSPHYQIENAGCLLARDWQGHGNYLVFVAARHWRLRQPGKGSILPRVRSDELVLNILRDQSRRSASPVLGSGEHLRVCAPPGLRLDECRPFSPSSSFGALVGEAARNVCVEPRALAVRALLHLPRVASRRGWVKRWQIQHELRVSAERLRGNLRAAQCYVPSEQFALRDLVFEEIELPRALPVLTLLHYLRSARPGSRYFALVDPINRLPVSLCSVSALEWKRVASQIRLHFAIQPERALDVSRVYSVDSAPPNAISTLLSKVRLYFRTTMPSVELLITAVDPNLGFTGSSYRAANWQQWMTVEARPYLYDNGRYVSPRQLREQYGSASLVQLQREYPGRFEQSRVKLLDSMIFGCSVNGETKVVPPQDMRRVHR
jgi:hypothetical protein